MAGSSRNEPVSRRRQSGFSLLEVIIAMGILAYGILGATAGQILAIRMTSNSREHSLAMNLATEQLEIFRTMSVAEVEALIVEAGYPNDPDNPIDPLPNDGMSMAFNRRWLIESDEPEAGMVTVTVEVDWTDGLGITRTTRVESLRADI